MNSKVAIIGGAGFIGSDVCRKLLAAGREVLVYDNFSTGREGNLPKAAKGLLVKKGDLNDSETMFKALNDFKPATVYQLAALHYIPYCDAHPEETIRVNVEGMESALQVCKKVKPKKVVCASSGAVYKIADKANEETDAPEPYDIYGYTKYFGEGLASKFYTETNIPTVSARIFNTYGPYETNPHVIPRIIDQLQGGNSVITLGDISPKRDFIYVEDTAEALIALAEKTDDKFDVFNVATGVEYSVEELLQETAKILNRKLTINFEQSLRRTIDRPHLLADVSKIKNKTGWASRFSLSEGLRKTLSFYLQF